MDESEKAKVWPVEKYARFVSNAASSTAKKTDGLWQHYSSKEGSIQLALVNSNHLMISSGTMIFESFSLWDARKWLKIITKGDSAMFIYKLGNENRRFRVKFSPMRSSVPTSLETCRHFAALLAPLVPIREMDIGTRDEGTSTRDNTISMRAMESDSQLTCCEDSQMLDSSQVVPNQDLLLPEQRYTPLQQPNSHIGGDESAPVSLQPDESKLIPVPDMGKLLQTQGKSLGRAYADTNFPTEQLGGFIRLCLTDANFPGFVEAVERELNHMTGST